MNYMKDEFRNDFLYKSHKNKEVPDHKLNQENKKRIH